MKKQNKTVVIVSTLLGLLAGQFVPMIAPGALEAFCDRAGVEFSIE